jgi:2,4-dienoyl-CoA reductase-like NADH-dependent reductase (Old Yellow Enzyme family)/thioredoxin reductase
MPGYQRLFSSLQVGGVKLSNRVMMPSMGSNLADNQGQVTQAMLDYYAARAAGQPGLMVVEAACVHPSGRVIERHFMCHDSSTLDGLKRLADVIKPHGTPAVVQLIHGGRNSHPRLVGELLAPSSLRGPTSKSTPRAMTLLEIEAMVECFVRAAERVIQAGFDGVEVHAAHEYLVHQFLTPYCNLRQDKYGGDLAGRIRFALEVADAVRGALSADHILAFRLSGDDHVRNGIHPPQAAEIARLLEQAGANLISVTGGVYETPHMVVPPLPMPVGTHLQAAEVVGQAVSIPVAGVGRVHTAAQAEQALQRVDLIACGRAFLADPLWLRKAAQGKESLTRPCIGCNQGCIDRVLEGLAITCVSNPWLGREEEQASLVPAEEPARVVVVGGGLAGMETARGLGKLGHDVVLFESGPQLGGQLLLSAVPPGKEEFLRLVEFYQAALDQLANVEIRLGVKAKVSDVCKLNPNAVVVATGSEPVLPRIPGAEKAPMVSARAVLAGTAKVGKRVAVLGGGNLGSEVAHYLAVKGHEVCIIELGLGIANDLGPARRYLLRRDLGVHKIRRHVRSQVRRLFPDRVAFLHIMPDGTRQPTELGPLDTFVAALGSRPRESLFLALESKVGAIFLIGDSLSPSRMGDATAEGARTAASIHTLSQAGQLNGQTSALCSQANPG